MLQILSLLLFAALTAGQIYVPQQIAYQLGVQTTPVAYIMVDSPANYAGSGYTSIIALQTSNLVLECQVYNMPSTALVKWYLRTYVTDLHGVPQLTLSTAISTGYSSLDPSRWKIGPGTQTNAFRIEIDSIGYSDEGSYECDVLYTTDSVPITVRLIVYVYSLPQMLPTYSSPQTTAKVSSSVTLTCNATGRPTPYIRWQRVGGSSALIPNWGRLKEGTTLELTNVQPGDRGIYQCTAGNVVGSDNWAVQFVVTFAPIVTLPTQPVAQMVGYNKQLTCNVQGNPIPGSTQVVWTRKGVPVTTGGNKRVDYNQGADYTVYYTLRFLPVQADDFDTYICSASNDYGSGQASVQLVSSSTPTATGTGAAQLAAHVRASVTLVSSAFLLAALAVVTFR